MKEQKTQNLKKQSQSLTTSKWLKRFHSISAYAIGNVWFRYYNLLVAEMITTSGQFAIRYIEHSLNGYLNKIL